MRFPPPFSPPHPLSPVYCPPILYPKKVTDRQRPRPVLSAASVVDRTGQPVAKRLAKDPPFSSRLIPLAPPRWPCPGLCLCFFPVLNQGPSGIERPPPP